MEATRFLCLLVNWCMTAQSFWHPIIVLYRTVLEITVHNSWKLSIFKCWSSQMFFSIFLNTLSLTTDEHTLLIMNFCSSFLIPSLNPQTYLSCHNIFTINHNKSVMNISCPKAFCGNKSYHRAQLASHGICKVHFCTMLSQWQQRNGNALSLPRICTSFMYQY